MPQKSNSFMNNRKKQVKIDVAFMFKTTSMQPQEAKEKISDTVINFTSALLQITFHQLLLRNTQG